MKGGIIGVDNTPTTSVASGVWSLIEASKYIGEGLWPGQLTPISIVGYTTEGSGGTSMSLPSGMQQNDLVIHFAVMDAGLPADHQPSGFTLIRTNTGSPDHHLSYKFMGSTPDTTCSWTTGETDACHIAVAIRGANTTTPFDVSIPTAGSGIDTMPNPPTITPSNNNCCILIFGALDDDIVASSVTAPSGFTMCGAVEGGIAGSGCTAMIAYQIQTTATTVDADAFGGSGSDDWNAETIALRHKDVT